MNYLSFYFHQGLAILRASLESKTMLTDIFLGSGMKKAWIFLADNSSSVLFPSWQVYDFGIYLLLVSFVILIAWKEGGNFPVGGFSFLILPYMIWMSRSLFMAFWNLIVFLLMSNRLIAQRVLGFGLPGYIHHLVLSYIIKHHLNPMAWISYQKLESKLAQCSLKLKWCLGWHGPNTANAGWPQFPTAKVRSFQSFSQWPVYKSYKIWFCKMS